MLVTAIQPTNGPAQLINIPPPLAKVNEAINALAEGKPENLATAADGVVITGSGQLRRGTLKPDLMSGLPANATGYNYPEKQVKP